MSNKPRLFLSLFCRCVTVRLLVVGVLCCLTIGRVMAQTPNIDSSSVKKLLDKADAYQAKFTAEKLYLNFDKPYYALGDTAWFKAYVLNGHSKEQSTQSAKLYVDLLTREGKVAQSLVLPVFNGLAQGFIPLTDKGSQAGNYTVRAYTNWLQNFGSGYFFYKQITIGGSGNKTWLLSEQHSRGTGVDSGKIQLAMRFTNAAGQPLVTRNVSVKIQEGTKTILKSEMITGVNGAVNGSLALPAKADQHNLSILVEDVADKSQRVIFPFDVSGANGDIDLQFLPEGGNLIAGLYNKVAFKAVGEDGLGRDVKGTVTNTKGETVADLQALHNGMGSFMLVPQAGETYTAKLMINGKEKRYPLPAAKAEGPALRVDGVNHPDDLYVYISSAANDNRKYTLLAEARDKVYLGSPFMLNGEGYFNTRIAKSNFPTGIVSLTILDQGNKPIAQRRVFIDHHDGLQINSKTGQSTYQPGDSIALALNVLSSSGLPVAGSFSLSVTNNAQVKNALPQDNIQSHILLASELKGHVENPAWYFTTGDEKLKEKVLDNLLLTQGWQGFDWTKVNQPVPVPVFQPEQHISVSGSLSNLLNKPAANKKVTLMSFGDDLAIIDTVSDAAGKFSFDNIPLADSAKYTVKVHNQNGKEAAVGIKVDEFKPTELALPAMPAQLPWNVNADSVLLNYVNNVRQSQFINTPTVSEGTLLKNVTIKEKKQVIEGLNGELFFPEWDISEKELVKEGRLTLLEYLEKNKSLSTHLKPPPDPKAPLDPNNYFFTSGSRLINIIIDGRDIGRFYVPTPQVNDYYLFQASYLGHYYAADIKKVYTYVQVIRYGKHSEHTEMISVMVLQTRSGAGPYLKEHYGVYAYRPLPIQLPRQFYSPKYDVKNPQLDERSTIYWEPNVVTDTEGNARLSFVAAGTPGTYTVNIEGTDMLGHFGVSSQKIVIK